MMYNLFMLNLTYEFKLTPSCQQVALFDRWLDICKGVWNYALAERKDWIRSRKSPINACSIKQEYIIPVDAKRPTFRSQCASLAAAKKERAWLKEPHTHVLQQVLRNLEASFVAMWDRGHGFPRFKKKMRSFVFPQLNKEVVRGNKLNLPKIGWVKFRCSRDIPEGFAVKQVRIVKRTSGYYAMLSLASEADIPQPKPCGHAIGIDVGISSFLATSDGHLEPNPRFFVTGQRKLKSLQRAAKRKRKGSRRWLAAMRRVARFHERLSNARKDYHFKLAYQVCNSADTIYVEDLNLQGLARMSLSKHVLDAGWGQFLSILAWVGLKLGKHVAKVPARGTSQECPECGVEVKKDLSVRVHQCPECGYTRDRDIAAAQVVLNRGNTASGLGAVKLGEG